MKHASELMLFPLLASAMSEGAAGFTMQQLAISHSKPSRGTLVSCHVCGASSGTLYKHGKLYVCRKCKEEVAS